MFEVTAFGYTFQVLGTSHSQQRNKNLNILNKLHFDSLRSYLQALFELGFEIRNNPTNIKTVVSLFDKPDENFYAIVTLFNYSHINFKELNVNYEDIIQKCCSLMRKFIRKFILEDPTLNISKSKKRKIDEVTIEKIIELSGDNFVWINEDEKMFRINNCRYAADFDKVYSELFGFNLNSFIIYRSNIINFLQKNHSENNYIIGIVINGSKKSKLVEESDSDTDLDYESPLQVE